MPGIFHENFECNIGYLVDVPATLRKPNKRWHLAFAIIRCCRAFLSLLRDAVAKKENEISRSPSHTIIHVKPELSFSTIDQPILTQLVKKKDLDQLLQLGGVEGVASVLETDLENGIHGDSKDNARRQEVFGSNTYPKPPAKSFFHFVVEAFKNLTILILLCCAAFSLAFNIKQHRLKEGWYDGGSIIVAAFLVSVISAVINFRQNRLYNLFEVSNNILVEVARCGRRQQISTVDIVVGDVVFLKSGDQVPADGLFLDGHSLQVDESSVTGENEHMEINQSQNPFLISGTKVTDGNARMLVTSVGMTTTWGEMMSSINNNSSEQTPLQAQLSKLTSSISKVGLAVAFLVLVVLFVRYFTGNTTDENGNREFNGGETKIDDLMNAVVGVVTAVVTIAMVAIPEGLPLAITLTLVYSMKKMMVDQAMVRKLSACETMGSATTICTGKTGILTLNQKKVTMFSLGHQFIGEVTSPSIAPNVVELIQQGVGLNTEGCVYKPPSGSQFEFSGSPTEKAILYWLVLELKTNMEELKQSCTILHIEAFNSKRKRSGVLMRKNADNTIHVHWKGAAEMILAKCSSYYDAIGNVKALDDGERLKFEQAIQSMADSSLQCIAFAHKQVPEEKHENRNAHGQLKEDCLTLLGLAGIKDPCRTEVKKAVEDCQYAGVRIKMITGDNVFTAKAIAMECGILKTNQDMDSGAVVEGIEFRNYTQEERMSKIDNICVVARSSPLDKLLMVQCLKQKGHVVAITGVDTNDAPVLKEADIGLSMGIIGTKIAKENSDIVILDDNFASVAALLRWGRCIHNNIQKFIQFQLTVNVAALVINFVVAVSASKVPLTAFHLLWVNLIVDTLGALALATEQPTKELMEKPAAGRTGTLITNIMWRNLIAQALFQIAIHLTLQFKGESIFGVNEKVKGTLIFNTSILCQVFNKFNARKLEKKNVFEGINDNKLFLGIVCITIVLQLVMVEFLKSFAEIERLNWGQWGACIGIASVSWPIGWVVKCIPVTNKPFLSYLKW